MLGRWKAMTAAVALSAALAGCSEPPAKTRLASREPLVRVAAVHDLGSQNTPENVRLLIGALLDEDDGVRFYAAAALFRLTGQRFGYEPQAAPPERIKAIGRWIDWYVGKHPESAAEFNTLRARLFPPKVEAAQSAEVVKVAPPAASAVPAKSAESIKGR